MSDKSLNNDKSTEYNDLVKEIKCELPNIILPSMGMYDDGEYVDINGKDFVMGDSKEE